MNEPVAVSRRIDVPAARVFAILADPARHPEMGDYEMLNYVVEYEQDRRIGWEPALARAGRPEDEAGVGKRAGHRWSYLLTQDGQGTVVTETFDCSVAPDWLKKAIRNGERWRSSMTRTLENLDKILKSPGERG